MTAPGTETRAELPIEDQAPRVVPLQAIFATDFCPVLVAITTAHTIDEVAAEVARHCEGIRVRALPFPKIVIHEGRVLPGHITVAEAGIAPLDHIAVEYDAPAGTEVPE